MPSSLSNGALQAVTSASMVLFALQPRRRSAVSWCAGCQSCKHNIRRSLSRCSAATLRLTSPAAWADLAIRFVETTQADLTCRRLCDVGWSLYASESYIERAGIPQTAVDLGGHNIISFDETMARSPGAIWLDQHKAGGRIVVRFNSLVSALNASVAGMGVTVLPQFFLAEAEPSLRRLTDDVLASRAMWIVFHPDVAQIRRVRAVIDFISAIVGREAEAFRGDGPARGAGVVLITEQIGSAVVGYR